MLITSTQLAHMITIMREYRIPNAQGLRALRILEIVREGLIGPVTISKLAKRLRMSIAGVKYLVDTMIRVGLLARHTDYLDRRSRAITITGRGVECLNRLLVTD